MFQNLYKVIRNTRIKKWSIFRQNKWWLRDRPWAFSFPSGNLAPSILLLWVAPAVSLAPNQAIPSHYDSLGGCFLSLAVWHQQNPALTRSNGKESSLHSLLSLNSIKHPEKICWCLYKATSGWSSWFTILTFKRWSYHDATVYSVF